MEQTAKLRDQITQANLPADLSQRLLAQVGRAEKILGSSGFSLDLDRELQYLQFVASLPFNKSSQDILDLKRAEAILDQNHYGLSSVKVRILEYLSIMILNTRSNTSFHAPILAFVGLVGSGKTSLAYSIAQSLGRKIIRIPFGGLGSTAMLRGSSKINAEAEPGQLMKAITTHQVNNPVILLDEIDRVASEARADIMGVLVELLDPEQNFAFVDHYVDFPFDLSKVMFITTANNAANIATAVMDRLELIEMPSYTDEEKITIGSHFLLPKVIKEAGLSDKLIQIDNSLWPQVVRPLGFDGGVRSLQRTIQGIVRKIARAVVEGNPGPFKLDVANIGKYLQ